MPCPDFFFALVFSRLERSPDPLVLSLMILNWLLNPYTCFELTFSTPDTFQVPVLTEFYDKTRVYLVLKAEFRFSKYPQAKSKETVQQKLPDKQPKHCWTAKGTFICFLSFPAQMHGILFSRVQFVSID